MHAKQTLRKKEEEENESANSFLLNKTLFEEGTEYHK